MGGRFRIAGLRGEEAPSSCEAEEFTGSRIMLRLHERRWAGEETKTPGNPVIRDALWRTGAEDPRGRGHFEAVVRSINRRSGVRPVISQGDLRVEKHVV